MKKLKFILLWTVIMLLSITNFAQPTSGTTGTLTWNFNPSDSTLTINGSGTMPDYYSHNTPWISFRYDIATVVIGDSVVNIGMGAFNYCTNLLSVAIGNNISTIDNNIFEGCNNLISINVKDENPYYSSDSGVLFNKNKTVLIRCPYGKSGHYTIPNSVTGIEDAAFYSCRSLLSVTIPNGVTTIGDNVFGYCLGLTSVNIPSGVTSIGNSAFYICSNLSAITIPQSVKTIGNEAFKSSSLLVVSIPSSVVMIGDAAFENCNSLTSIDVESGNTHYSSDNGVLFNKDKTVLIRYPGGKSGNYVIPNSVTTIEKSAFSYCSYLASVSIPNGVIKMEDNAFRSCWNLAAITLPNTLRKIGDAAFKMCEKLTSITIPSSVVSIGLDVFTYCWVLHSIEVENENVYYSSVGGVLYNKDKTILIRCPPGKTGQYSIPNGVKIIGNGAFQSCEKISSISLPNSVEIIGDEAFATCISISSMVLPKEVESIGRNAFDFCYRLSSITNLNLNPISISNDVFYNVEVRNCRLLVPMGSVSRYQNANVWKDFNIAEGYVVNVEVNNSEYGYLSFSKIHTVLYKPNTEVHIKATANSDCSFVNWTKQGKVVSTDGIYRFTVTEDVELVANFTKNGTSVETIDIPENKIYPNPTTGIIYLTKESKLKIYTIYGQLLLDTFAKEVDLSAYPQGMYFLQVDKKQIKITKN